MLGSLDTLAPVFLTQPANRQHNLNQGCVAWWLTLPGWDGGRQWIDLMGENHGTLSGAAWSRSWTPGGWGSLSFNGTSNYVSVPDTPSLRPGAGDFAISCWFQAPAINQYGPFVTKRNNSTFDQYDIGVGHLTGAGAVIPAKCLFLATYPGLVAYHTTADIADGAWHHAVFIRPAAGTLSIYVDGVSQALTGDSGSPTSTVANTVPVLFGNDNGSNYYNGKLDDIRYYGRLLSASEVWQLYNLSRLGYPGVLNRLDLAEWQGAAPTGRILYPRAMDGGYPIYRSMTGGYTT
jgi:hypothetical protein